MRLLKHFRSRSRLNQDSPPRTKRPSPPAPNQAPWGRDFTTRLPDKVLAHMFAYICPHTQDASYEPCEQSQIGDGCMLCDLRDLAHCAQVCRKWYAVAQQSLYASVRIDAVHYCELEQLLAERRRKAGKHFRSRSNIEPVDVPNIRLNLLCRTLREQPSLAAQTLLLKLPYMTRETAKADLARTVAALPNLRYVDLPDGFYSADPSCLALRQEMHARCPDIRKMEYRAGAEDAFELLAHRHWPSLEQLVLANLAVEPATLRIVLASLPSLRDLTFSHMPWMDDAIFHPSSGHLPDFPAVHVLKLQKMPHVTADGLNSWLEAPHVRERLGSLTLDGTGVTVHDLHSVLWSASSLRHLSIVETVSKSLTLAARRLAPLTSISLTTMHFEVVSSDEVHGLQKPAESYYAYLASSLHHNALPALTTLYVRDHTFPELLLLPPMPGFGGPDRASPRNQPGNLGASRPSHGPSSAQPPGAGFDQTLEVFSKGIDELEWVFTAVAPPAHAGDQRQSIVSGGRPLSAYSASRGLGPQWAQGGFGGEARKSVIVGNGLGGFLAVPQEEVPRPGTSDGTGGARWATAASNGSQNGHRSGFLPLPPKIGGGNERRHSKHDLWR